ncbi:META domain-containing protein [Lysobacter korlensis]|uniref:META domain-containing protein n=1 Tax=Lysobacter korlensis TaxID=553636 RepID=A0ABV6RRL5_9GAMM
MRDRTLVAAALTAALLLAGTGCSGPGGASSGAGALTGAWQLTSGADAEGPIEPGDAFVTLIVDGESAGGRAACNTYDVEITGTVDDLTIGAATMTEMACLDDGLMELESRYITALSTTTSAEVGSASLVLRGDEVELAFEPIPEVPTESLTDTDWRLTTLLTGEGPNGTASSVTGEPTLLLTADGRITGSAGCRGFEGRYDAHFGEITTALDVEAADCPAEFVDQENHILGVLGGFRATVEGDQLTLMSTVGSTGLVYTAAAAGS